VVTVYRIVLLTAINMCQIIVSFA